MKIKAFIILFICLTQFFSTSSIGVEPDEVLKNKKQEFRARDILGQNRVCSLLALLLVYECRSQ